MKILIGGLLMAYIVPNTRVKLLRGCNIPSDGKHTLYFASKSAQTSFFEGLSGITFTDYSFQRGTDGTDRIRVGASYGSLAGCSYMLFNNESFLNKNFYAWIIDIRYVNNETCDVYYRIDNLQTWMFDITLLPSYVERTHDDGTGIGIDVDEGLSPGDMELQGSSLIDIEDFGSISPWADSNASAFCVLIQTTLDLRKAYEDGYPANADLNDYRISAIYTRDGNMIDSIGVFMVPILTSGIDRLNMLPFLHVYNWIYTNGFGDAVIQMWVYPTPLLTFVHEATDPLKEVYVVTGVKTDSVIVDISLASIPVDQGGNKLVSGLDVKNSKLLRYPFTQLLVTNNNGSAVTYRCEDFGAPSSPTARVLGTSTPEAKIRIVPINYGENTVSTVMDTNLALDTAPAPPVSYVNDPYTVWLAQNRNTIENNFDTLEKNFVRNQALSFANSVMGVGQAAVGGKSLFGGQGVLGAITGATQMMSSRQDAINQLNAIVANAEDMRQRPATASGVQSVGLSIQNHKPYYSSGIVQPRISRVKQLDDYFTMFGYRVDRILPINLHVRTNFTYIKTSGLQIRSNIPKDVENEIASMFDNGIWFWTNNSNMCDFSQSNNFLN